MNNLSRRDLILGITGGRLTLPPLAAQVNAPNGEQPTQLRIGSSQLEVTFSGPPLKIGRDDLLAWINRSATAVARYFHGFPVAKARLIVISREGRSGVLSGRTWGDHGARTRLIVGENTNVDALDRDWVLTHEFVHYGFPDMPNRNHWIEEGLATYVEPIARVAVGALDAKTAWFEMMRDMPKGQPQAGDQGLDHTHTWGRTYWGGAIFCLVADVNVRKQTKNLLGLRDALQSIIANGGNIESAWPIEQALTIGDAAVGGDTLMSLYAQMSEKATPVDLAALWKQLGVERDGETARFDDTAPLAAIRRAIH
jgi:hypothetical protein